MQGVYELKQNGNIKVYSGRWMRIAGERYALKVQPRRGCCSVDRPPRIDHEAFRHVGLVVLVGMVADRAGSASSAAAALARPEPWLLGVDLADPPAVVASGAEFHRGELC
jgi:hypothetical protein